MDSTYNGVTAGVDYPATLGPAVSDRVVAMFVPGVERIVKSGNGGRDASSDKKR